MTTKANPPAAAKEGDAEEPKTAAPDPRGDPDAAQNRIDMNDPTFSSATPPSE